MTPAPFSSAPTSRSFATGVPAPLARVVLVSALVGVALAVTIPLVDPDEGRNAEVAREMAVGGDLVIPHLAGMPYLDKPPGLFWAAAAAVRLFGPTRWAPRLPAIVASVLTLLLLGGFARRLGGAGLAWRSAALLAVAPLFVAIGAYVIFDMPLTVCVTLLWTRLALEIAEGPKPRRRLAMFAAVALGVLIKGPVMLAWALGGSVAAALVARSRAPLRWLAWWPGWALFLGLAGGWFALACARHPEYVRYAFLEESLERLTRTTFDRAQPWWFALAVNLGGALPWSVATPWAELWRRREPAPSRVLDAAAPRVALGFLLFALAFFTGSRSKLVTYLLPALPPLALMAGLAWTRRIERGGRPWRIAFGCGLALVPLALAIGLPVLRDAARRESSEPLARAIATVARDPAVRYERCYSAGADYRRNRRGTLVTERADQTTSVYQARYRETLRARGMWTPLDRPAEAPPADVVVRPVPDDRELPANGQVIFQDRRFTAYRITSR